MALETLNTPMKRLLLIPLLLASSLVFGQAWSGILDPSRAIDWSQAGVVGGIPSRTTLCTTTACTTLNTPANVTAANINAAIASAPANTVVLLPAGTFNVSSGIDFAHKSNITLRGQGPNSHFHQLHWRLRLRRLKRG
jgi:hypothetical protein